MFEPDGLWHRNRLKMNQWLMNNELRLHLKFFQTMFTPLSNNNYIIVNLYIQ